MQLLLADLILVTHALFVVFVVLGLVSILLGGFLHWRWVRNLWFRLAHSAVIGIVIAESWLGLICPLTEWENRARKAGGGDAYSSSFIQHWLHQIMFFDFDSWVFTVAYTLFGIMVLFAWLLVPPTRSAISTPQRRNHGT